MSDLGKGTSRRRDEFIEAVRGVCRSHGVSLSHEDGHGLFVVTDWNRSDDEWMADAVDKIETSDAMISKASGCSLPVDYSCKVVKRRCKGSTAWNPTGESWTWKVSTTCGTVAFGPRLSWPDKSEKDLRIFLDALGFTDQKIEVVE